MICTVTLSTMAHMSITDTTIQIDARHSITKTIIDMGNNRNLSGEWGATLSIGSRDIYTISISTNGTSYGPCTLDTFSGAKSPKLDVVLFHVGSASSSSNVNAPLSSADINSYVRMQIAAKNWTEEQGAGILGTVKYLGFMRDLEAEKAIVIPGGHSFGGYAIGGYSLAECISHASGIIERAGIDPRLVI